jgi:hypothetical protein
VRDGNKAHAIPAIEAATASASRSERSAGSNDTESADKNDNQRRQHTTTRYVAAMTPTIVMPTLDETFSTSRIDNSLLSLQSAEVSEIKKTASIRHAGRTLLYL